MESVLSRFDFDEFWEFTKKESYDEGYKARQGEIDKKDAELSNKENEIERLKSLLRINGINPSEINNL